MASKEINAEQAIPNKTAAQVNRTNRKNTKPSYNCAWDPSQYGAFLVRLQVQMAALLVVLALKATGVKVDPRCAPLHHGWLSDWPQLHQK
jgi:hypothetical protein